MNFNPFERKHKHKPVPKKIDWVDDYMLSTDDEMHQKAMAQWMNAYMDEQRGEKEESIEPETAQDMLYQKGYNDGQSGSNVDLEFADDPNYWMGYQDGQGDQVQSDEINIDSLPANGAFSVQDVHDRVNQIMSKKNASYYPIYQGGQTCYQCDECHYTTPNETSVRNHIRLAHVRQS